MDGESIRVVNRLKNTNAAKFETMCKMHLSFLLHLDGDQLQEFLSEKELNKARVHFPFYKRKPTKEKAEKSASDGVFGSCLSHRTIQAISPVIEFLKEEKNVKQEGLFRKSGHQVRQRQLRSKIHNWEDVTMELEDGVYSPHDCASVLKGFLGEMPEPLLTEAHYLAYCQIPDFAKRCTNLDDKKRAEEKQVSTLQLLLQLLPKPNSQLLNYVLQLLHLVASNADNKMTADNLGTMFAPHILVPRKLPPCELQAAAANGGRIVSFMIQKEPQLSQMPEALVRDIKKYWEEVESSFCDKNTGEDIVNTTKSFTDRAASAAEDDGGRYQDYQLSLLATHIANMPDCSRKRKLLKNYKKMNGVIGTPQKQHKRTRSFGDTIKKIMHRSQSRSRKYSAHQQIRYSSSSSSSSSRSHNSVHSSDSYTPLGCSPVVKIDDNDEVSLFLT
ncbi:DgyrCDS1457 [Dimorphilus gyrociliatus]|uniref:DgyrCDS1457 n=1 Tax=Dimorphilus gyrociliatus TaxID=2664684 RepID=A0A7I8V7B4_9ANNE|nr:DgyrCDS1457 [Dimorphilus gyrociliatus]